MIQFLKLKNKMQCLTVFRGLLSNSVLESFLAMAGELEAGPGAAFGDERDLQRASTACAAFTAALYAEGEDNLSDYIKELVLSDENPYIQNSGIRSNNNSPMRKSLLRDLNALNELGALRPEDVMAAAVRRFPGLDVEECVSPSWNNTDYDLVRLYEQRLAELPVRGFGIFAKYHAFLVNDGQIVPVKYPDSLSLDRLTEYEREREQVLKNTQALLRGEAASNVLLYGDAGTGKSSTIKAIANEYKGEGLRLIEVKKNQLYQIPELMETISRNPLKFILFIDDLSFSSNDSDFAALKAILEGSVAGKSGNLVVYATSNRRHLIKETMSDRGGDDIHLNDTMQELMSLSARFGLVVTYSKPNKDVYLNIVRHLAQEYGVNRKEEALFIDAEAFAIRNGGRSPRTARQFMEQVCADIR